jgi:PhnB protein
MAKVSTYLNFTNQTEEAFNFYKSVFGTEFIGGIARFGDIPPSDDMPPIAEADKHLVMNVALPILGGHVIMGTDAPESMGFRLTQGNNVYITLHPDTRDETERLFKALSEGGQVEQELQDMFWGDYYGSCHDQFGVHWMFNCDQKSNAGPA